MKAIFEVLECVFVFGCIWAWARAEVRARAEDRLHPPVRSEAQKARFAPRRITEAQRERLIREMLGPPPPSMSFTDALLILLGLKS